MEQPRKRLFIEKKAGTRERQNVITWAAQNMYDTLVFSLDDVIFKGKNDKIINLIKRYSLNIEAGGRDFSLLLPRRLFMFNRDLFRMKQGKRNKDHHFCPTNPKTIAVIREEAQVLFTRALQNVTSPRIFHLLPDEGHETTWCACPACRAFSPPEQNIIAVNIAADVLEKLDPKARLAFFDFGKDGDSQGIAPRKNMLRAKKLPNQSKIKL